MEQTVKVKYRKGYAEGGLYDEGGTVDPVSGNEVPYGALQEEVRDDVPAQLSEGEFVFPADVVRFIGLDKLMKIRTKAKEGLGDMEAEGQIGGQPMEMEAGPELDDMAEMDMLIDGIDGDDFEGDIQAFAEGGSVAARRKLPSYAEFTGREFGKPTLIEHRQFINKEGDIITLPFLGGTALRPIPEGYYPYDPDAVIDDPTDVVDPVTQDGPTKTPQQWEEHRKDVKSNLDSTARLDRMSTFDEPQHPRDFGGAWGEMSKRARDMYERYTDPNGKHNISLWGYGVSEEEFGKLSINEQYRLMQRQADSYDRRDGISINDSDAAYDKRHSNKESTFGADVDNFVKNVLSSDKGLGFILSAITGMGGIVTLGITKLLKSKFGSAEVDKAVAESDVEVETPTVPPEAADTGVVATPPSAYTQPDMDPFAEDRTDPVVTAPVLPSTGTVGTGKPGEDIYEVPPKVSTGAVTGTEGVVADPFEEVQPVSGPTSTTEMDVTLGEDPDWLDNPPSVDPDVLRTKERFDQVEADKLLAKAKANKIAADKAAYEASKNKGGDGSGLPIREDLSKLDIEGRLAFARGDAADAQSYADIRAADRALYEQSQGGGGIKDPVAHAAEVRANQAATRLARAKKENETVYAGGQYGLAKGGMASKKKPKLKKMRKDNTSGLAAKKKSKERAKAKKGALAAKRN
jgi:hypothetical protein